MRLEEMRSGMSAEHTKVVTAADVELFAGVIDDFNPVHLDEEYARQTVFKGRIAHGLLGAGLISGVISGKLPGPGAIYLGQTLRFKKPVHLGDSVTARVEIVEVIESKKRVRLNTTCRNQRGEIVIEGEATVMVPDR